MITREQLEDLGFVYKQKLINNNRDFVNKEINTLVSLSLEGRADIICEYYKNNWNNINSIDEMRIIIEKIKSEK